MRAINKIIIHCAETKPDMDIGAKEIREWHVKDRGWSDIGYHFVIRRNGVIETGRAIETPGAHVLGHNADSIGICLVGGWGGKFDYTRHQILALDELAMRLVLENPNPVDVAGHCDFTTAKTCPNFDVRRFFSNG